MLWNTRTIETRGSKDQVKLICSLSEDHITLIYELIINGVTQEKLEVSSLHRGLGYKYELSGTLHEDVKVIAVIKSQYFFMRPKYTIYVGNEAVHSEKGRWGGL